MTREYELMVILKPLLPEDIKSNIEKNLKALAKRFEGDIKSSDVWGKKHLAYEIDGQEEGYYIIYKFEMPSANIAEFEKELKLLNDILRFLVVREDNQ